MDFNSRASSSGAFILLTAVIGFWLIGNWVFRGNAQSETRSIHAKDVLAALNKKAEDAKGGDEAAVRRLADGIFDFSLLSRGAPEAVAQRIKDRFVKAETNYRKGKRGPVTETGVVNMINQLAVKISAPDYAKISLLQVRQQRVAQCMILPHLVGTSKKSPNTNAPEGMSTEMSPVEAAHIALSMLNLKIFNESYQVTPDEWASNLHAKEVQDWQMHKNQVTGNSGQGSGSSPPGKSLKVQSPSAKAFEIKNAFDRAASALGPNGMLSLIEDALDTLGIER